MKLKHIKTILKPQSNEARIVALDWAPNGKKFAACSNDRIIMLFDENGDTKDRFATKSADAKFGKKSYVVKALAFSPDSSKLAVGQSDNIVYVYKLGEKWEEKKAICNKFFQPSSVTCLIWPIDQPIVLGLLDGKVRVANIKTNKSHTVYNSEKYTVSLSSSVTGKGFISGHADGSVIRYFFDDEGSNDIQGKLVTHSSAPYALAWGANNTVLAAGCDKRICVYSRDGRVLQQFDYSKDLNEKEFTVASSNPSGQSIVIGSFDKLRVLNWSSRKGLWDEGDIKIITNLYTVSGLSWKKDGSKLCVSNICGGLDLFDCCLKKVIYKDKFELNYVGASQVIVNNVKTNVKIVIKSYFGHEINEVKIAGKDKYIIAHTSETLMLGDMITNRLSEVPWRSTGDDEKFILDNENVCMIYRGGELSIIEYGISEILGCVRTEFTSPHHISIRINERKQLSIKKNKKLAYLIDLKTITVLDLCSGLTILQISNDSKIDWIELNEIGTHIIFRDKKLRLQMCNLEIGDKINLLNYCSYVQWVPGSDVIVAQSRENLCIWYNIKCPDRVTSFPLKGDILNIIRNNGKTEVLVNEGIHQMSYSLDEGLIEFQTALEDSDFGRAVSFLESIELTEETESMWKNLAEKALFTGIEHMDVAERCYAALGDICKTQYLHDTVQLLEENEVNKSKQYKVKARLALLTKNFKMTENIYLENNKIDEAIDMYKSLFMWDEAIEVASVKGHSCETSLRDSYFQWLLDTNQYEMAGELKENNNDYLNAISLYLKGGVPARAARLIILRNEKISDVDLINRVAQALLKYELYEKAGELFESMDNKNEAMKCYRKGNAFHRAVELARHAFPGDILRLEEEWGNYLVSIHQLDNAIQHFIESGSYAKALESAINAHQWQKVATILDNQDNVSKDYIKYYQILAEHYVVAKKYDKAEEYFIKGKCYRQAVETYINVGMWEKANAVGLRYLDKLELAKMYENQAQQLEIEGRLKDAEKLYLTIDRSDEAINMYKKNKMQKEVIRLINKYNPEVLDPTLVKLAEEAEKDGNIRQAEQYYLQMGDWKSAVNLYRKKNMWEDAYRVSQSTSDSEASKQVAYLWAKHLGGESAVKLLNRLGLLDKAVEYACEHNAYEFAFELAKHFGENKMPEIYGKYAMYLEDEGRFSEAEMAFIKANKPREAVLMWVHQQDWDAALLVAEKYDLDSVSDVLVGQARFAFNAHDYKKSESYLIRAQRPELAVKLYREAGMWEDAIRVCKEYVPHKLENLQDDYDRELLHQHKSNENFTKIADASYKLQSLLDQGRQWESNKEYLRSVECYLKITFDAVDNPTYNDIQIMEKSWVRAGEIALKFLSNDQASKVVEIIGPRLIKIKKSTLASEFYKAVDKIKDALNTLIDDEEWDKAKQMAREINPKYENYVEEKYKIFLKSTGKAEELENLDLIEALNIYAEQNNWDKCLSMAQDTNPHVLQKYLAMYATQLIKSNQSQYALHLYIKYGSPYFEQNFNIYKRIFKDIVSMRDLNNGKAYNLWSKLRDFFYKICMDSKNNIVGEENIMFEKMLYVSHYYSIRSAIMTSNHKLDELISQISISLLRYTDIIPADKAFYEAGICCRNINNLNLAFIFLNRYLDLVEAIDDPDGSSDMLDNTDFEDTDIPLEVPLPDKKYTSNEEHNEVKEWVLSMSMDQKLEHKLPVDERKSYIASLIDKNNGEIATPCVISGFPVLRNAIDFKIGNRKCISENYNKFQMAYKMSRSQECADVLRFIGEWCGSIPISAYSFEK